MKTRRQKRRERAAVLRWPWRAIQVLAGLWVGGFIWFLLTLPAPANRPIGYKVDGIVVLTGSAGRVAEGIASLEQGIGDRLLISGVNPQLASTTIRRAIGGDEDLSACCIDLGREALDTRGNAAETAEWARRNGYGRLEIITADFHMKRALLELRRQMPEADFFPHSVDSERRIDRLAIEYTKYIIALLVAGNAAPSDTREPTP